MTTNPPPYDEIKNYGPVAGGAIPPEDHYVADNGSANFTSGVGFDNNDVRRLFIRKVYAILSVQLIVTAGFIAAFMSSEEIKGYMRTDGAPILYASLGVYMVTYFCLVCPCCNFQRKFPLNVIMLCLFTIAMSVVAAAVASSYNTDVVLLAAATTATIVLVTFMTKFDITKFWYIGLIGGLAMMFVWPWFFILGVSETSYAIYCGFGVMLFTFYLAYDTKTILGGGRMEIGPDDYIVAVVQLYVDIVQIFLYLLRIFGRAD
ncbi:Oidioi.mRNA.OKI2018_I69.XSR.g16054.t2.cds [Oikopleura dioica]|uniref:Oidioi.mRNA.OKI2018_I69.XSR.g16054.t2.cds n=1 Tax=Oikopleura dioica TaxID=34765 RepID=A0ABN7SL67_OIKDI|nr:Oidioi.mRNA.OKI2018_I69.XSR.g16054.t2.cds [Oikopleura dioica]